METSFFIGVAFGAVLMIPVIHYSGLRRIRDAYQEGFSYAQLFKKSLSAVDREAIRQIVETHTDITSPYSVSSFDARIALTTQEIVQMIEKN